ncbi:hypothetical protein D3C83_238180 [compost metagenome]
MAAARADVPAILDDNHVRVIEFDQIADLGEQRPRVVVRGVANTPVDQIGGSLEYPETKPA